VRGAQSRNQGRALTILAVLENGQDALGTKTHFITE
jgi:hypothetical protein